MKKISFHIGTSFKLLSRRKKLLLLVSIVLIGWFYFSLPRTLFDVPTSYIVEDNKGNLLNATIAADGQWRFPLNENLPEKFVACITTFEDRRFFYHPGIDPISIARAIRKNIQRSRIAQGGSTITMQVMRLSQKDSERTFWNKLKESLLAVRLECRYSKHKILALYAAHAPFGGNVVGLDAAAWRYYGRAADKLSWGEMATLAVLPNAPALVHPGKNRVRLLQKRNGLLDKLLAAKKINTGECELAKQEPLPEAPLPLPQAAAHLLLRYKKNIVQVGIPTKISTTIDGTLQRNVAAILQQHNGVLKGNGINNACALVLDVETGNALAYVGNVDAGNKKQTENDVDVIGAPRSPGSALKPVLYAAMLSDGLILSNSLVADVPMQIGNYAPQNFDHGYDGAVPAANALARSLNIPAVKLLQQYKYQRFYETLKQCGITTLNRSADTYGLSLILGGCEVTMWDMAGLYASMARSLNHEAVNNGRVNPADFHAPSFLKKDNTAVENERAAPANTALPGGAGGLDPASIYLTFQAMKEVMRPGEEGLWQQFNSAQSIAWKTGTSFGFRDGWAIGVTAKHVVAVWVGNADGEGRPGLIGVHTAAPILFDIFRMLPAAQWFAKPASNTSFVAVCRQSGFRAGSDCNAIDTLFASPNASRSPLCPYHKMINLDATGNFRVTEQCESPSAMQHSSWFVLGPAMEYYYKQKNADYKMLPEFKAGCGFAETARAIEIIYPTSGAKIYVPVEMAGEKGKTVFSAAHRRASARIFWSLDDAFVGTTQHFHQIALNPTVGQHIITLVDENGVSVSRAFEIIEKGQK